MNDDKLLDFIDKKLEFYNKMTEDKVNSQFKNMWFNELYDDRIRGINKIRLIYCFKLIKIF